MNENINAAGNDVKSSRTEIAVFAGNLASSKRSWTKDIVKRVDPISFSAAHLKRKRLCSRHPTQSRHV
jgi:hypothetical protein